MSEKKITETSQESSTPKKRGRKPSTATKVVKGKRVTKPKTSFDNNKEIQKKATAKSHTPEAEAKRKATKAVQKVANEMVQGEIMDCIRNAMLSRCQTQIKDPDRHPKIPAV